jgi:hypothetical protein
VLNLVLVGLFHNAVTLLTNTGANSPAAFPG